MKLFTLRIALGLLLALTLGAAVAGGGPQNVLIVVNSQSKESLEIGNAYRRARDIPYRQLLAIQAPTTFSITNATYVNAIETPIRAYLKNQQLGEEITTIVLTRGLPQLVTVQNGRSVASLLAAMDLPRDGKNPFARLLNPYCGAPVAFSRRQDSLRGMYLVSVLHGYHTGDIRRDIAQGVDADGTAPAGRFVLQASPQIPRATHAGAADLLTLRGLQVDVTDALPQDHTGLMGYFSGGFFSGLTREGIASCTFRPGAIADLAQNYSAAENNFDDSQPPVLFPVSWLVQAGVTGVHGVVGDAGMNSIPMVANQQLLLDRYTNGFSLAESFYAALPYLCWQNVIIGDPLCTPYAQRPAVEITLGEETQGVLPVQVTAVAQTRGTAIGRIDLYLDDRFLKTIYEPAKAVVTVRVGDAAVQYRLPRGATLRTLLEELAKAINANPDFATADDGVRAVAMPQTSSLQLIARSPGTEANNLRVAVMVDGDQHAPSPISARLEHATLSGGGVGPTSARGTLSFVGRRVKPGDEVIVQIQQERIRYVVPEGKATLPALLDALVGLIEATPSLQQWSGVHAVRDRNGMPFISLEARTAGEQGNLIPYQLTVKPVEGSQLKGYPDMPMHLSGGHDGSAANADIHFVFGEATAHGEYQLDTTALDDGYHRLRAVAYDSSPAQVQVSAHAACIVKHSEAPPVVTLPEIIGPACEEVTVPITVNERVSRVEIFVDGLMLRAVAAAPFTIRLPLNSLGAGSHDIWAVGYDADGKACISPPATLEVITPPEVRRVTPGFAVLGGGIVHRIAGTGFQPNCTVSLSGVPARAVTVLSPNLLEVVSDAGPAGKGAVEVTNPDGLANSLPNAFEYYQPRVASVQISPTSDILDAGRSTRFTTRSFDQFGCLIKAPYTWELIGAGKLTPDGVFTAPNTEGTSLVRVNYPDGKLSARAQVTVGTAPLRDGRLRQWLVLGPFPDPDNTVLTKPLFDEVGCAPAHGDPMAGVNWQSLSVATDFVDFASTLSPNTNAVAYAHVYLRTPADSDAALVFGANDGIAIWLNGEQCFFQQIRRTAADPDQTTLPITLRAGWNRLLVKVDQESGGWGFYLRLVSRTNTPLKDIVFALDRPQLPAEEK